MLEANPIYQINPSDLQVESSSETPQERSETIVITEKIINVFLTHWQRFIPQEKVQELREMTNRIIVTDDEMYPHLALHFLNAPHTSTDESERDLNEDEVKRITFIEAGADYYARIISESLHMESRMWTEKEHNGYKLFTKLISMYGDDIHRLFFGTDSTIPLTTVLEEVSVESNESESQGLSSLYTQESQTEESLLERFKRTGGVAFPDEGIIFIKKVAMWNELPKVIKNALRKRHWFFPLKNETVVASRVNATIRNKRIAHELAHILQSKELD